MIATTIQLEIKKASAAFAWIIGLLNKYSVQYQITGGLAAKVYGADRPLADIDIDIPNQAIAIILPEIKDYLTYGPSRYKDEEWDIFLTTLDYHGQLIDLSGADDGYIFDKTQNIWKKCEVDLSSALKVEIDGLDVSVISKKDLIAYKNNLKREVDLLDLAAIGRS